MKQIHRALAMCLLLLLALSFVSCSPDSPETLLLGRWEITLEDSELGEVPLIYHFTEEGEIYLEQRRGDEIAFSILSGSFAVEEENVLKLSLDDSHDVFTFSVSETELVLSREGMDPLRFRRV